MGGACVCKCVVLDNNERMTEEGGIMSVSLPRERHDQGTNETIEQLIPTCV